MAGNTSLQRRAGSNIGVIPAFSPRVEHTHAKFGPIVLGDQVLWDQTEEGELCAVGTVVFYNQSDTIPLDCDLYLVDEEGHEFFVTGVTSPAAAVGTTSVMTVLGLVNPMPLAQGYKLLLRVAGPGYVGGAFYSVDCASLTGYSGVIKDLTTAVQDILEPPPGKGLGNILATSPVVIVNTDTVPHKVDIYIEKDGISTLILKGMNALVNIPLPLAIPSLGEGNKIRAAIQEAIATPGKPVRLFSLYLQYDGDPDIG
jgi:hypothetical protein